MDLFKMNLQLFAEEGEIDPPADKTFTQADVDKIVQDRLAREHKKYADYEDVKGVLDELKDFGYEGDAKSVREALREAKQQSQNAGSYKEAVESYEKVTELPSDAVINALAKKWGKDPKQVEKALQKQIDATEQEEEKAKADEAWGKQVQEFEEKFPNIDLSQLAENAKFKKFIKGKALSLVELYEDFVDFVGESDKEIEKLRKTLEVKEANNKNAETSTGSVKGEKPIPDYISKDTFEKHKNDRQWVIKNLETITKSRAKW